MAMVQVATVALIQPLAQELPYVTGAALEKKLVKKRKKEKFPVD